MTLQQILEKVKKGQLSVEHAEDLLKKEGYEEMDYAKLDTTRKARTGFAEVVYCARKADEHLLNIYQKLYEEDGEVFGTRASEHQYELVKKVLPDVVYDPVSGRWQCVQPEQQIFLLRRKLPRQQSISAHMWRGSMMWESVVCTDFFPGWIPYRRLTVWLR